VDDSSKPEALAVEAPSEETEIRNDMEDEASSSEVVLRIEDSNDGRWIGSRGMHGNMLSIWCLWNGDRVAMRCRIALLSKRISTMSLALSVGQMREGISGNVNRCARVWISSVNSDTRDCAESIGAVSSRSNAVAYRS
jgi:hypothetical protein